MAETEDMVQQPRAEKAHDRHVLADDRLGRLLFSMSAPAIVGMFVMIAIKFATLLS